MQIAEYVVVLIQEHYFIWQLVFAILSDSFAWWQAAHR